MADRNEDYNEPVSTHVDNLCDRFERELGAGAEPCIEDYLDDSPDEHRAALLRELLSIELSRMGSDDSPSEDEYVRRFSTNKALVRELFESRNVNRTLPCGTHVSHFRLHALGGLSEIYEAQEEGLQRRVAVKMPHHRLAADKEKLERFRLEAEVTGRLDHPGIVPIYSMGEDEAGRPFYSMRFVEGATLRRGARDYHESRRRKASPVEGRMRLHELIRCLVSAAKTIAYAHQRGVLHRDLKPDNIMIGKFGETLVVDWGLFAFIKGDDADGESGNAPLASAQMLDRWTPSTAHLEGTPGFMSPEQFPENDSQVGVLADVYGLGSTLYYVLTETSPFRHDDDDTLYDRVSEGDFAAPHALNPQCPRDLEAVCLKAMATDAEDRYESALKFAEDLERWLADESVSARKPNVSERLFRTAHRHRTASALTAFAVLLLTVISVSSVLVLRERNQVETQLRRRNLVSTAQFAAHGLGAEIERRWDAMSVAAQEDIGGGRTLYDLVQEAEKTPSGSPQRDALNSWLLVRASPWFSPRKAAESWFICGSDGTQLARYPWAASVGETFHYRAYFQDEPLDVSWRTSPEDVTIIQSPTISPVYVGMYSKRIKVVFSIPIRKESGGDPIGVLGMVVDLEDQVNLICDGLEGTSVAIVDLRENFPTDEEEILSGVVIKHPSLRPGEGPYRISLGLRKRLMFEPSLFVESYLDPVESEREPHIAVMRTVDAAKGLDRFRESTGWAVVVQESSP